MKKNNKGFTLAEMLIVVAIIGVLIAILVPTFSAQLNKAKVAASQANVRTAVAEATSNALVAENNTGSASFSTKIALSGSQITDIGSISGVTDISAGTHTLTVTINSDGTATYSVS